MIKNTMIFCKMIEKVVIQFDKELEEEKNIDDQKGMTIGYRWIFPYTE